MQLRGNLRQKWTGNETHMEGQKNLKLTCAPKKSCERNIPSLHSTLVLIPAYKAMTMKANLCEQCTALGSGHWKSQITGTKTKKYRMAIIINHYSFSTLHWWFVTTLVVQRLGNGWTCMNLCIRSLGTLPCASQAAAKPNLWTQGYSRIWNSASVLFFYFGPNRSSLPTYFDRDDFRISWEWEFWRKTKKAGMYIFHISKM